MENKNLDYLNIGNNKIGDDGIRHVTEGLQQNDTLSSVRLYNCKISVKGNYIANYIIYNMPSHAVGILRDKTSINFKVSILKHQFCVNKYLLI